MAFVSERQACAVIILGGGTGQLNRCVGLGLAVLAEHHDGPLGQHHWNLGRLHVIQLHAFALHLDAAHDRRFDIAAEAFADIGCFIRPGDNEGLALASLGHALDQVTVHR